MTQTGGAVTGVQAPRLVEVVAAFSLATDLGLGQPLEHGMRSCMIAIRLAEYLGLDPEEQATIYWVELLSMVGCTADSHEMAELFGDDIQMRSDLFATGPSPMAGAEYFLSRPGVDESAMGPVMAGYMADCRLTGHFAERLGLGGAVSDALVQKFERWDGYGMPAGLAGTDIAVPARLLAMTWRLEHRHRLDGADAAVAMLEEHAGATLDPDLVAAVLPAVPAILAGLEEECWEAVIAAEPARSRLIGDAYDSALEALGDFSDLKSPWFSGHSRAVADLAEAAGWRLKLAEDEITQLRHAALVHAIGRTGVPNTVWDKRGTLSVSERERMQLHPYLTDRILRRGTLAGLAELASSTQERLDGSGYPKGLSGSALSLPARILAAADVYQALLEPRPHRPAFSEQEAADQLREEAKEGRLDPEAAEAVLGAAGHPPRRRRPSAPADLTARELDVLRLIARGLTSAEVADELSISIKTVGSHIEHIYAKTGAANRSTATLFAMEHGIV